MQVVETRIQQLKLMAYDPSFADALDQWKQVTLEELLATDGLGADS